MRFGAVLKIRKSYGAVRCGLKIGKCYGAVRFGFENPKTLRGGSVWLRKFENPTARFGAVLKN